MCRDGESWLMANYTQKQVRCFQTIDTEEKAYWLGFLTADGWLYQSKMGRCKVGLQLSWVDYQHVVMFRDFLGVDIEVRKRNASLNGKVFPQACLEVVRKSLFLDLTALGLYQNKSLTVKPCCSIPAFFQRHYWRGLVDGDGSIRNTGAPPYSIRLAGTEAIVRGFYSFVRERLGILGKITLYSCGNRVHTVTYAKYSDICAIAKLLYNNCSVALSRKLESAKKCFSLSRKTRDLFCITKGMLLNFYYRFGAWRLVASAFRLDDKSLWKIRHRLGMV